MIEQEKFVEHAMFGGNRYGTSKGMLEDMRGRGRVVVLDIEMEVRTSKFLFGMVRCGSGLNYESIGHAAFTTKKLAAIWEVLDSS